MLPSVAVAFETDIVVFKVNSVAPVFLTITFSAASPSEPLSVPDTKLRVAADSSSASFITCN